MENMLVMITMMTLLVWMDQACPGRFEFSRPPPNTVYPEPEMYPEMAWASLTKCATWEWNPMALSRQHIFLVATVQDFV